MTYHDDLRTQLQLIESLLREHQYWQTDEPHERVFASEQPFCMDTMEPLEWLQWVLIPRMHQLLDGGMALPKDFAIAPYYEMALDTTHPMRDIILPSLAQLDAFFSDDPH